MLARVNRTTRSKPVLVMPPGPAGTPTIPGMIAPPQIVQDADDRLLMVAGTYSGEVSRARNVTLDGAAVNYRLIADRFTPAPEEIGKLLVNHETINGSGGSVARQVSMIISSENLLANPLFLDGLNGWSGGGQLAVKDELSPDPIVANAPAANFVWIETHASNQNSLRQQPAIEWADGEQFRWRLSAASPVVRSGSGRLRVAWFDEDGILISPPANTFIALDFLVADEWKTFTGTATPPAGAVSLWWGVQIPGTTDYTTPIAVADLSVKKV